MYKRQEERLLEVDPQNGDFRVLCFNRTAPCSLDAPETPAAFGQVVQKGRLLAFVDADVITSVGQDEVLIQHRARAAWSIYMYDRNADMPPPRAFVEAQKLHLAATSDRPTSRLLSCRRSLSLQRLSHQPLSRERLSRQTCLRTSHQPSPCRPSLERRRQSCQSQGR